MTFAARSHDARSAPAHAATSAEIAAMLSSVLSRRVTNWVSRFGIIWAAGSRWWGTWSLNRSTITSGHASDQPDRRKRQHLFAQFDRGRAPARRTSARGF